MSTLDDLLAAAGAQLVVAAKLDAVNSITGELRTFRLTDAPYLTSEDGDPEPISYTLTLTDGWDTSRGIGTSFVASESVATFSRLVFADTGEELGALGLWRFEGQRAEVELGGVITATGAPYPLGDFETRFEGISEAVAVLPNGTRAISITPPDDLADKPITTALYQGFGQVGGFEGAHLTSADDAAFDAPSWALTLRGRMTAPPAADSVLVRREADWGVSISTAGIVGIYADGTATDSAVTISPEDHFALSLTATTSGINSTLTLRHRADNGDAVEILTRTLPTADITNGGEGLTINDLAGEFPAQWEIWEANFADFAVDVTELDKAGIRTVDSADWLLTWRFEGELPGSLYGSEQGPLPLSIVNGPMLTTPSLEGDDPVRFPDSSIIDDVKADGIGPCHDLPVVQVSSPGRAYAWAAPGATTEFQGVKQSGVIQTPNIVITSTAPGQINIIDAPPEITIDATLADAALLTALVGGQATPQRDGQIVQLSSGGSPNDALLVNVGAGGFVLDGAVYRAPLEDNQGDPAAVTAEVVASGATWGAVPGFYRYTPDVPRSVARWESQVDASELRADVVLRGGPDADLEFAAGYMLGSAPDLSAMPAVDRASVVQIFWPHGSSSKLGPEMLRLVRSVLGWHTVNPDGVPALGIHRDPAEYLAELQAVDPEAGPVAAAIGSDVFDVFGADESPAIIGSGMIELTPSIPALPPEVFAVLYDRTHAPTTSGFPTYVLPELQQRMLNPWRRVSRGESSGSASSTTGPVIESVLARKADAARIADRMKTILGTGRRWWPAKLSGRAFASLPIGSLIWVQWPDLVHGLQSKQLAILTHVDFNTLTNTTGIQFHL